MTILSASNNVSATCSQNPAPAGLFVFLSSSNTRFSQARIFPSASCSVTQNVLLSCSGEAANLSQLKIDLRKKGGGINSSEFSCVLNNARHSAPKRASNLRGETLRRNDYCGRKMNGRNAIGNHLDKNSTTTKLNKKGKS